MGGAEVEVAAAMTAATTTDPAGEPAARVAALKARRAEGDGSTKRRRPRPATTARILATGVAVTTTGLLVAFMGAERPEAQDAVVPPPPLQPPAPPTTIVVVVESTAPGGAPTAGAAQPAPTPSPAPAPAPVAASRAS